MFFVFFLKLSSNERMRDVLGEQLSTCFENSSKKRGRVCRIAKKRKIVEGYTPWTVAVSKT
jgi:hypothetical protein